jgi:hypothetical protein
MALFFFIFIKTILETGQLGFILFFSVYSIDTVITIVVRLKTKKIFNRIVRIYTNIWQMKWGIPMFWFHLFMQNSTVDKWARCLYGNEKGSKLFFL